ncbi:glycosyltransferase family 4 protein [Kordiimonas aestuarii]|uniref:glycosyltransferase family 4 protein n=1 Tax=Kordiimonas aestuarii TaxID=1005925 RepID=UPI0021D04EC8|nr:glycosyltransferase family 4 protein [Kordiimonas aestuarii]
MPEAKCLIITTHYKPLVGGAQSVYDALASKLPARFCVLTARRDYARGTAVAGCKAFDDSALYDIIRIPRMRPDLLGPSPGPVTRVGSHIAARRITREVLKATKDTIARTGANIVCIGALDALGWLVGELREHPDIRVVVYTHGEEISQKAYSGKAEDARGQALRAADAVIAVSGFTASLIAEKYQVPPERIKCLGNGVDIERFRERPSENVRVPLGLGAGPLVLAVGRLVARKGFDRLLEAWPKVLAAVPEAQLAIVGKGPLEAELTASAQAEGMNGSVHMLGHVPDGTLPSLYASADIFAMPNRTMPDGDTEGFGLVFLEAAAAGIPSVGGRAGGAVDAIRDGTTGLLVDGEDTSAIAFALTELLTDEVKRLGMADAARDYAMSQGWADKAEDLVVYLDQLLGSEKKNTDEAKSL